MGGSPSLIKFSCQESPCRSPKNISHTNDIACIEGSLIAAGSVCTANCHAGYVASTSPTTCRKGVFERDSFLCMEASCAAPRDIVNGATLPCSGLQNVRSGATCMSQCQPGYVPSVLEMKCSKGRLEPPTF